MTVRLGFRSPAGAALEHGVPVGPGAGTVAYGPSDLSAEMRLALAAQGSRAGAESGNRGELPGEPRHGHPDMPNLVTRGGARVLGFQEMRSSRARLRLRSL
ncbi:hypothetical protein [Streptomyces shenzhenensis]|uniref:hypothetical protein n=1 Tax=Streptomyces shenzhenensis TaxID=943815 RepID=UPI0015F06823|nr:hypothetical protein [Streptomyces shenzhenensis]